MYYGDREKEASEENAENESRKKRKKQSSEWSSEDEVEYMTTGRLPNE